MSHRFRSTPLLGAAPLGRAVTFGSLIVFASLSAAAATELPRCGHPDVMLKVQIQYDLVEQEQGNPVNILAIDDVHELTPGNPPIDVFYDDDIAYIEASRYCAGRARLDGDAIDRLVWRVDLVRDTFRYEIRTEHCSTRHDPDDDNCAWIRPGG